LDRLNRTEIENVDIKTIHVLRRKLDKILGVYYDTDDDQIKCRTRTFSVSDGESTIKDITSALEESKKVIIDTSRLDDEAELLIGSIITHDILYSYRTSKERNKLHDKPVISIVIEEAPRVLSDEVLRTSGSNIYSDIAREGRKFKIGLIAITQLTSVIPKTILANMNTQIILGNELSTERNAIIQSASQDLSSDDRNIASLDKGEAIISSNFTKFAVPVKIPLFEDEIKKYLQANTTATKRRIGVIS
jgi:DNA helicase HerA-like ATPase